MRNVKYGQKTDYSESQFNSPQLEYPAILISQWNAFQILKLQKRWIFIKKDFQAFWKFWVLEWHHYFFPLKFVELSLGELQILM